MTKYITLNFFFFFFLVSVSSGSEPEIFTEDFPPYNYIENGEIKGIVTDLARLILRKHKSEKEIKLTSWVRCLEYLNKSKKPVGVLSVAKNSKRKAKYKWVGPVIGIHISAFALKGSGVKVKNLEEIRKGKHLVAFSNSSYIHDYLRKRDFPQDLTAPVFGFDNVIKRLFYKRVPIAISEELTFLRNAKKLHINMTTFKKLFTIKTNYLWIAFNKKTKDSTIKRWQETFESITDMERKSIEKKYGVSFQAGL